MASDRGNSWTPAIGSVDSARSGGVLLFPLGTWCFLSIGTRALGGIVGAEGFILVDPGQLCCAKLVGGLSGGVVPRAVTGSDFGYSRVMAGKPAIAKTDRR